MIYTLSLGISTTHKVTKIEKKNLPAAKIFLYAPLSKRHFVLLFQLESETKLADFRSFNTLLF